MERASRVCATCKARKKGCDKILPRCGYCTQRHLVCVYEDAPADPRCTPGGSPWTGLSPPSNLFLHSLPSHTQMSLDCALHLHVAHVLHASKLSLTEVSSRYFRSFHNWLPVISRELLDTTIFNQDSYPPADLSLLVLALYLVTLNPSDDTTAQATSPQTLYMETRMLFTQVQAILNASTRLVQAGLLLAAYEYARGKPHAAYISIGTCARIASVVGIDKSSRKIEGSEVSSAATLQSLEGRNIWWGMIVLERLVLYECPTDHLHPTLEFPSPDTELPMDLNSTQCGPLSLSQHDSVPTIGDIHATNVSRFGRQVQAVALLVQVEQITSSKRAANLMALREMDEKLRGFLTILMSQSPHGHQCGANGVIIRSLVRLHQYILNHQFGSDLPDAEIHKQSHAALDTLARMMVEVAHDHLVRFVPGQVDSLPLSCSYNMRSMMDLMQDRRGSINSQNPPKDLEAFMALYEAVYKRWRPASSR